MGICPKCGLKNDDDAAYCTSCGISLQPDLGSTIERHAKQFANDMEKIGKKAGKTMVQTAKKINVETQETAKRFEKKVDQVSQHAQSWYDRTFGIIGPLIESFIVLIVFRLVIAVLEIPSVETPETIIIASVLLAYLLPLFAVTLLSNYTKYFAKKSYQFKVFSPLFHTIALVLIFWIVTKILYDLSIRLPLANLGSAAVTLENSLPTIFVFVLLISYVVLIMNLPRNPEKKQ